jgi:hypothetical protein
MRALVWTSCLVLSGCCFLPFPTPTPDAGAPPDAGVAAEADGGTDGGVGDGGTASDGGLASCVDADGGLGPTTDRAVTDTYTLPDCAVRGARSDPTDVCDARARVLGLWRRCTVPAPGFTPIDADLLELRAETWHQLEAGADGGLTRRLDLDGSGALEFRADPSSPALLQVDARTPQGSWLLLLPQYETGPDRLRLTASGGGTVDYARITVP